MIRGVIWSCYFMNMIINRQKDEQKSKESRVPGLAGEAFEKIWLLLYAPYVST